MAERTFAPTPGERARAALWLLGVVVLVVGVLGGGAYGIYRLVNPGAGAEAVDEPVRSVTDLERVCFSNKKFPKAPAYDGPGPHPVRVFVKDDGRAVGESVALGRSLPPGPEKIQSAWSPRDVAPVQIVGCAKMVEEGDTVKTCSFVRPTFASAEMKEATYEFTVYEVKTRKKVASTRMTGEEQVCPTLYDVGKDPGIFSRPSPQQFVNALRSHVEKA